MCKLQSPWPLCEAQRVPVSLYLHEDKISLYLLVLLDALWAGLENPVRSASQTKAVVSTCVYFIKAIFTLFVLFKFMGSVFEAMTAFATLLGVGSTVTDVRDKVLII